MTDGQNKVTITIESARTKKSGKPIQIFVNLKEISKVVDDYKLFGQVIDGIGDKVRSVILSFILHELLAILVEELEKEEW